MPTTQFKRPIHNIDRFGGGAAKDDAEQKIGLVDDPHLVVGGREIDDIREERVIESLEQPARRGRGQKTRKAGHGRDLADHVD